ncbi:MAG TPA: hypothetical protein DCF89_09630 [Flavobacteriales bacterium]|nr:hypothetical protein [Flavobacteriales bacterium]
MNQPILFAMRTKLSALILMGFCLISFQSIGQNCGNDTVLYTLNKATDTDWQTVAALGTAGGDYPQVGQRFEAPQPITVYGACFYAKTNISGTVPATFNLDMYSMDTTGGYKLPDTLMASVSGTAPLSSGDPITLTRQCLTFPAPVTTSDEYFIVIDGRVTSEALGVATNSWSFWDGAGEGLSVVYYDDGSGASYVDWYDQTNHPAFVSGSWPTGWNYDYLLEPIVSYDLVLEATYTGADSSCTGATKCVETDSISPIFGHRMYNKNAINDTETIWGDGATSTGDSSCHDFISAGNFTIEHTKVLDGWTISCAAQAIDSIYIDEEVSANFTYTVSNDTVELTNLSSDSAQVLWTLGSTGTSSAFELTVVFPSNGAYDIELIVWSDAGCSDTITQTVNITVGMEEKEASFSLYPNPAGNLVQIDVVNPSSIQSIHLYDVAGQLVRQIRKVESSNRFEVADLEPGQYIVRCFGDHGISSKRLIVTR